jgi:hypothetical protein
MPTQAPSLERATSPAVAPGSEVPFGVNEVRLNWRQWLVAAVIFTCVICLIPAVWEKAERFDTGPDYRIPYDLSKDYWLYSRRLGQIADFDKIILLGDSVVWGEYVLPDGTLSHFLNQETATADKFINGGLNGLFPLAQEGLVKHYGKALSHRKVILQCNVLWMTSPKADLSTDKEEQFNHSRLVPQFFPRIPCYKADANERFSAMVANHINFISWVGHLQNAYFGQKSIPAWTLEDDGGDPSRYPNAYKNPLSQITLRVLPAPVEDPQRGPASARHRPWTAAGQGTTRFDWVPSEASLQWRGFQRLVETLRARGNDLLVVVGPFNEHMIAEDNRAPFLKLREDIVTWLKANHVAHVVPGVLPSELYADASHPLTEGYKLLAHRLFADEQFQAWLRK